MDAVVEMKLIRESRLVQFSQPVQILASQQLLGVEVEIEIGALATTLWMPPTIVTPDYRIVPNPPATVLGIRVNLRSAPMLAWGLQGNNVSAFTGPVERLFVTRLSGDPATITLLAARGIGVAYSGGNTAAGTPSSAPSISGGNNSATL